MENYISEGSLVCLEGITAGSNLAAGELVMINTGSAASVPQLYSIGVGNASISASNTMGWRCVGVLAEDISAGKTDAVVWTEGIFKFGLASGCLAAMISPGVPVFPDSGAFVLTPGNVGSSSGSSGQGAIGVICQSTGGIAGTGAWVNVKIRPAAYRWTTYKATPSATNSLGLTWGGNTNT